MRITFQDHEALRLLLIFLNWVRGLHISTLSVDCPVPCRPLKLLTRGNHPNKRMIRVLCFEVINVVNYQFSQHRVIKDQGVRITRFIVARLRGNSFGIKRLKVLQRQFQP